MMKKAFAVLQQIGKSLMVPVAVLPVAGLLLGIGSGLLNAGIDWIPSLVPQIMTESGNVIFDNMPLIFAIGTTLGLTDNDGVAALAAVTCMRVCACGGDKEDSTKTYLDVGVFDAGLGTVYFDEMKKDFEAYYANESFEDG